MSTAASFCSTSVRKVQEIINGRKGASTDAGEFGSEEIISLVEKGIKAAGSTEKIAGTVDLKKLGPEVISKSESIKREYEALLNVIAQKNVESILDNQLDSLIRKYVSEQDQALWDTGKKEKVKQLIRGYYNTVFVNEDSVREYVGEISGVLREGIERKADEALVPVFNAVDGYRKGEAMVLQELDKYQSYLAAAKNLDREMEKLLNLDSVEKKVQALDTKIKESIGIDLKLGSSFNRVMASTTKRIGEALNAQLAPKVDEAAAVISYVKDSISTATGFIEREKNLVNEAVTKWKTTLTSRIQAEEKKIVQSIVSSIKLKW